MVARISLAIATFTVSAAFLPNRAAAEDIPLAKAVREFNEKAKANATGKDQPPLTTDEVVASIRGWIRERISATDEVYGAYQKIADSGMLPPGAYLSYTTGWKGFNGYDFDLWWVDLTISTGKNSGYTFRLRDQKLSSRPAKK